MGQCLCTTSINDKIEPTKEDLFTMAVRVGLNEKEGISKSAYIKIKNFVVYWWMAGRPSVG